MFTSSPTSLTWVRLTQHNSDRVVWVETRRLICLEDEHDCCVVTLEAGDTPKEIVVAECAGAIIDALCGKDR